MLIYKRGKGNVSRGAGVAFLGAVGLFGCREVYHFLIDLGLNPINLPIEGYSLRWADLIVGFLGLGCAVGMVLVLNNARVVDFLLETEAELKRVSWSPPDQLLSNTVVVIVTVFVLAAFIFMSDKVISEVMRAILR